MIEGAPFLEPLPDAQAMREIDRWAIERCGIPSLELMERAGAGLADVVAATATAGPIVVVCGAGNNGGDGLVAARLLHRAGREVAVLLLVAGEQLAGDAARNLARLHEAVGEDAVHAFDPSRLHGAAAIVDCILGTGFAGEPRAPARVAIEAINAASAPVVAADVPSGVDASTGEIPAVAVTATATATFAAAKPGLWIHPGKARAGAVHVIDIGIPEGASVEQAAGLIGAGALAGIPRRGPQSTKFTSGHVAVCGGSPGLTGAPSLAAAAAMRAGAGYVTACLPEALEPTFENGLLEVMTLGLPGGEGAVEAVLARAARGALVVGPGLGREPAAKELARELARRAELPLVLDADGLNAHAGRIDELAARSAAAILTPHEGELGRLLDVDAGEIHARRLHHARDAARRSRSVVVLKGDDTIVARPDGVVGINAVSAPALATAGSGDVLSGVLAAMLAKRVEPFAAACAGVRLHAIAGRLAGDRAGSAEGVIASDVIACLPRARETII